MELLQTDRSRAFAAVAVVAAAAAAVAVAVAAAVVVVAAAAVSAADGAPPVPQHGRVVHAGHAERVANADCAGHVGYAEDVESPEQECVSGWCPASSGC